MFSFLYYYYYYFLGVGGGLAIGVLWNLPVIPVWKDTAGSVKLWEITRGIVIEDYGKVTSLFPFPFVWIVDYILAIVHICSLEGEVVALSYGVLIMPSICMYKIGFQVWHNTGIIHIFILTFSRCPLRRERNNYLKWYDYKVFFCCILVLHGNFGGSYCWSFYIPGQHSCMVHCGYQAWKLVCSFGHTPVLFCWDVFSRS